MIVHISSLVHNVLQALTVPTLAHCLSHTRVLRTLVILSLGTPGHILSQVSWHFSSKMHTSAVYVKPLHVWNSEYCDASYFQSALIFLKYGCLKKIHENTYQIQSHAVQNIIMYSWNEAVKFLKFVELDQKRHICLIIVCFSSTVTNWY